MELKLRKTIENEVSELDYEDLERVANGDYPDWFKENLREKYGEKAETILRLIDIVAEEHLIEWQMERW